MPQNSLSHGLWKMTSPPAPATGILKENVTADVAIIGAGYTGISAALHLAQRNANVVLLEAVDIGFGGAGRNVGLVNAGLWLSPDDVISRLGADFGERILKTLGHAPQLVFSLIQQHAIACEAEHNGTLHCAVGLKGLAELETRATQWQQRGVNVQVLNASEASDRLGTSAYSGALLDPRAGTIQPLAYARGLARAALDAGARIFTSTPALAATRSHNKWTVHAQSGAVCADWIVVATDAYAHGPWPEVRTEQIHLPYFNFATEPLGASARMTILPGREGAWDTKEILSSFRLDHAGHLIIGSVGALRNTGMGVHRAWARRTLRKLFPQVGNVPFKTAWYGMIGMTDDNIPRFHKLAPNVIAFSGYNGRGIAPGTMFGRILAEYIHGNTSEHDLPLPATHPGQINSRFAREAFYEIGAQIAHLAQARY